MRNTNRHMILALALVGAPALLARASESGELSNPPPRSDRATVVPAPEAELHALDDTLKRFDRIDRSADVGALSSVWSTQERMHVPAAEAELRALEHTLVLSTERYGRRDADVRVVTRPDRVRTPLVYSPEAELDALLAWQKSEPVPGPGPTEPEVRGVAAVQLERAGRAGDCTCMR